MKVLHLVWEYPPFKVGGIGTYLAGLCSRISEAGVEAHVICPGPEDSSEVRNGVHVHRFKADFPSNDFLAWVLQMNFFMKKTLTRVWKEESGFGLIHAHDWLSTLPAIYAKHAYKVPLVATIHATEQGRWGKGQGVGMINELEYKLTYEAWKIHVLSDYMKWELQDLFGVPESKIWVIPPGVNREEHKISYDYWGVRNKYAAPWEKIVFFIGRMFPQKGCDVLVGAAPHILSEIPNVKFVCGGKGFEMDRYKSLADWMGVGEKFYFTGFMDDMDAKAMMQIADVFVIPSRHEPFGLVALEGMVSGTPVVVADTGGLSDIVTSGHDGMKMWKGHSESLAWCVKRILSDQNFSNHLVHNAFKTLEHRYDWGKNVLIMRDFYRTVLAEKESSGWTAEPLLE